MNILFELHPSRTRIQNWVKASKIKYGRRTGKVRAIINVYCSTVTNLLYSKVQYHNKSMEHKPGDCARTPKMKEPLESDIVHSLASEGISENK